MTCREIVGGGHVCGPSAWVEFSRKPIGIKWCFGCRKHTEHFWVVEGDPEPNYYGPNWGRKCSLCNQDRTLFPGYEYKEMDDE
jgi:hypothetical protein